MHALVRLHELRYVRSFAVRVVMAARVWRDHERRRESNQGVRFAVPARE